ncbi:MAG: BACON domain-containing protein [Bacteroidales bacterium]|nr:BACON domain-containing protein [Bacteroidales bacterium]
MKSSRIHLLALAVVFLLAACHPEIEFVENSFRSSQAESSLAGGNLSVVFPSDAGSASVDLEATGKWSAAFVNERAADWCSLSTSQGKRGTATITVSVKENPDYDERSASINFTCGDVKRTIVVTQKQKDALLLSSARQDVGMDGGRFTIEVRSNVRYEFAISKSAESWLTLVGTKGLTTYNITFNAAANETFAKREGEITFTSELGKEVVKVYQEADTPTIVVSNSNPEVPADPGQFTVDVRSNVDVTFEISPGCNWLHVAKTNSMSTNSYAFSVDENEKFVKRQAEIKFKCAEWNLEETVSVTQQAAIPTLFTGSGEYEIAWEGGELDIDVTSNFGVEVQVPITCDWIQIVRTKALTTKTYHFLIEANESFTPREGTIIFRNESLSKEETVRVVQKAEEPTLIIGKKQYQFEPEGGNLSIELSSNLDLKVDIRPDCDWIAEVKTKTVTDRVHTFTVAKNNSRSERSGWIVFKNDAQGKADSVRVDQAFQQILVPCDTLKAAGGGWTVSFETVGPNPDDYRIVLSDRWLSQAGQEKFEGKSRFFIEVQAQADQAEPRSAEVLVYDKNYTDPDTVRIFQYEKLPSFSFTTKARTVTLPEIEGANQMGFVSWGDGTQESWSPDLSHTYKSSGTHTVRVEIRSKKRVPFRNLEDGMTINIRELRK